MSTLANFYPSEGTLDVTPVTVTFPWKARKVVITNDSSSYELEYKFNASESFGTLKASETISVMINSREVLLDSPSNNTVAYRVWGFG